MEDEKLKKTIKYILEQKETDESSETDSSDEEEDYKVKIKGLIKKQKDKIIESLQIMVDNEFRYINILFFLQKLILTGSFYFLITEIFG